MALHPELLETMSSAEFVGLVKSTSDQEIRDDFAGEHRGPLLDAIFARFPHQFRPDKAGDRTARIDFRVTGGPGDTSDTYGVLVDRGTCTVEKGAGEAPDLSLMLGPGRVPQADHRHRQPGDDVHDGQGQGARRPRPGQRPRQLVRGPQGLTRRPNFPARSRNLHLRTTSVPVRS